jgi:hypothetical protein
MILVMADTPPDIRQDKKVRLSPPSILLWVACDRLFDLRLRRILISTLTMMTV